MGASRFNSISSLLAADPHRWHALGVLEAFNLPQGCIGAGFVRNLVWDSFHGRYGDCRSDDLDVLFYDPTIAEEAYDREIELALRRSAPSFKWSVKNQARMHVRNDDQPYLSVEHAMRFWPETATAIAAIRSGNDCSIIAPFGLSDLNAMILRPTSSAPRKLLAFNERISGKNWLTRWPKVSVVYRPT